MHFSKKYLYACLIYLFSINNCFGISEHGKTLRLRAQAAYNYTQVAQQEAEILKLRWQQKLEEFNQSRPLPLSDFPPIGSCPPSPEGPTQEEKILFYEVQIAYHYAQIAKQKKVLAIWNWQDKLEEFNQYQRASRSLPAANIQLPAPTNLPSRTREDIQSLRQADVQPLPPTERTKVEKEQAKMEEEAQKRDHRLKRTREDDEGSPENAGEPAAKKQKVEKCTVEGCKCTKPHTKHFWCTFPGCTFFSAYRANLNKHIDQKSHE